MKRFHRLVATGCAALVAAGTTFAAVAVPGALRAGATSTPPQFGTLSNFDVFNDTGQVTHGFEIELDGISPSQVTYEFGAPYERYGNPTVTAFSGGTLVTYASGYDPASKKWQVGTPLAPATITPTMGHQCWTGGSATYVTDGCDHFGLGLSATPTNIVYNWLTANPQHAGQLIHASGHGVSLPAPSWSVTPAAPGAVNKQPVVQAVINAPEFQGDPQFGQAIWVKVFMAQTASKADLGHLVTGDKEVPTTVETDWAIIQSGAGGTFAQQLADQVQPSPGDNTIVRRYEFYKYTGAYDAESHEALPVNDSAPVPGDLGNLIGNQMVAINLPGGAKADTTAPTVHRSTLSPGKTKAKSLTLNFTATDPDSKAFTFYCSLDSAVPTTCTSGITFKGLAPGSHTVAVYAADQANNASAPVLLHWTVLT